MARNNLTSEPDGGIPTDEQAAAIIADRDSCQNPSPKSQAPDTAGYPYGDGSYSEGARKSLDRLVQGAYGSGGSR